MFSNRMHRALSVAFLIAILSGEKVTVEAQQPAGQLPPDNPVRQVVADSDFEATPENLGDLMLIRHRYHEALDAYLRVSDPSSDVWNKMGMAYEAMFDQKDALRCYKHSLTLRPNNADVLNNLGTIYDMKGESWKAEELYRKALKADPKSARIALNLGTNLMAQRKYPEGSEIFKRALSLDADVLDDFGPSVLRTTPIRQLRIMNYYKAKAFAQDGMSDRAIQYLQKAVREGLTGLEKIARDSSFARLRGNPAFERLIAQEKVER